MFPTVFNNRIISCFEKEQKEDNKLLRLANSVLNNIKFGLSRKVEYLDYIKFLYRVS